MLGGKISPQGKEGHYTGGILLLCAFHPARVVSGDAKARGFGASVATGRGNNVDAYWSYLIFLWTKLQFMVFWLISRDYCQPKSKKKAVRMSKANNDAALVSQRSDSRLLFLPKKIVITNVCSYCWRLRPCMNWKNQKLLLQKWSDCNAYEIFRHSSRLECAEMGVQRR